jgi:hypothetical protein
MITGDEGRRNNDVAPTTELIRYLGLLRDVLITIRNYGLNGGRDEALFCGFLADAVHNLPGLLLHYREFDEQQFWRDARGLRTQVPPRLAAAWDSIFQEGEPKL